MTRREAWRLVGTGALAVVTAMPLGAGILSLWVVLFSRLPTAIGVLAVVGAALAPIQLIRDLRALDAATPPPAPPEE